jgi:hypothetical protein
MADQLVHAMATLSRDLGAFSSGGWDTLSRLDSPDAFARVPVPKATMPVRERMA